MLVVGITGAGGGVGSAVLHSLALAELETWVVCFDSAADATGLHRGNRARLIPKVTDSGYREAVLEACVQEGVQALIPGLDSELETLAEMAGDLRAVGCTFIGSSPEVNRLLFEKQRTSDFFENLDLPFVKTVSLARAEELLDVHGFPLLVKPLSGSASRGVHVVFTRSELRTLLRENVAYVAQPYLVPLQWGISRKQLRPEDVWSNHALVQKDEHMVQVLTDGEGQPYGVFLSSNQLKNGAVVRMEPLESDEHGARAAAVEMVRSLAWKGQVGPCNCQGRVTAEGPCFYEINPRFSGGTGMRASLGFNEVEACLRVLALNQSGPEVKRCLETRYSRLCGMHPAELLMDLPLLEQLKREGFADIPPRRAESATPRGNLSAVN